MNLASLTRNVVQIRENNQEENMKSKTRVGRYNLDRVTWPMIDCSSDHDLLVCWSFSFSDKVFG